MFLVRAARVDDVTVEREETQLNISQRISATMCRRAVNGEGVNLEGKKNIAQFRATDLSWIRILRNACWRFLAFNN